MEMELDEPEHEVSGRPLSLYSLQISAE